MITKTIAFDEIVSTCLKDPEFFHQLQEDPAQALSQAGLEADPSVVAALKDIDYASIRRLYRVCNPITAPMC